MTHPSYATIQRNQLEHHTLLSSLGEGELTEEKMKEVEEFVCKMYKLDSIGSVDEGRAIFVLFLHIFTDKGLYFAAV